MTLTKPADGPFNDLIAQRMKELQIERLEEFADYADLGRATLYALVRGRISPNGTPVRPSIDTLITLAKALGVPVHDLLYQLEPEAPGADQFAPTTLRRRQVQVAGWVGAGPSQNEECLDEYVWVDGDVIPFKIRGDSMAAGKRPIFDGDLVLVNPHDKGFDGAAVVARLQNDGYVCKTLKIDKFGQNLVSRNGDYTNGTPPYIPAAEVAEIIGRVIEVRSPQLDTAA